MKKKMLIMPLILMCLSGCEIPDFTTIFDKPKTSSSTNKEHNSVSSSTIEENIEKEKLRAPNGLYYEDYVIHWNEVSNADSYIIKLEADNKEFPISRNQFAISTFTYQFEKGNTYNK